MPSVVGLAQADAEAGDPRTPASSRGRSRAPSTKGNDGKVIAQDQPAQPQVDKGSTVVITVGEFTATTTTTTGGGSSTTTTTGP